MATLASGVEWFRCVFMRSLHFLNGGTLLHFRMNRNKRKTKGLGILLPFFHHLFHHDLAEGLWIEGGNGFGDVVLGI